MIGVTSLPAVPADLEAASMELLIVLVAAVVVIACVSALAPRLKVAAPLLLILIGVIVSLIPAVPAITIDPEWILAVILPPLLYSAAVSVPVTEFRRDFKAIGGLAVVLVIISALVLGAFLFWVIPGINFAMAVALGAILSPTDAVATSIIKKMGISRRVVTMLEGESMLNDASSLVLMRTAVAAAAAGFSFWGTVGQFVWAVVTAIAVGWLVGFLTVRLRWWLKSSAANTALSLTIPFLAYIPTELLGGSGLVAAVTAGIVTGVGSIKWFSPEQRISDTMNWRMIELVLEGAVFLMMGLELYAIITRYDQHSSSGFAFAFAVAGASLALLLLVRALYVSPMVWMQGRKAKRGEQLLALSTETAQLPSSASLREHKRARKRARVVRDANYYSEQALGWRGGVVLVWAGMRGVVTLAAAQTLPRDAPERDLLVLIAFLVAVGSLLIQGLTIAPVVRMLGLNGSSGSSNGKQDQMRDLERRLRAAALKAHPEDSREAFSDDDGQGFAGSGLNAPVFFDSSIPSAEKLKQLRLRLGVLQAMRDELLVQSRKEVYSTEVLRSASDQIDAYEMSLRLRLESYED